jgi:D-alanine-D-alanine ligase-like ATP-grasp enzyme
MRRYAGSEDITTIINDARSALVPPLFVKPVQQEGSVGVVEAVTADELGQAVTAAGRHGDVLVQQRTPGTEVSVTLYDDERGRVRSLPATVVVPKTGRYFDHLAKRRPGRVALHTLHRHDNALVDEAEAIARDVYREIGGQGMISFDVVVGEETTELLDVNTVPTLSRQTPLLQQLQVARVHPGVLFDRFIQRRLSRGQG